MSAKLITKKEIGVRYSAHPCTVDKWVKCRILPIVKINARCVRFDVAECDAAMGRRTQRAGSIQFSFLLFIAACALPFILAFMATKWQHDSHKREMDGLLNRRVLVRFQLGTLLFSRLTARVSRAFQHFGRMVALMHLEALRCA